MHALRVVCLFIACLSSSCSYTKWGSNEDEYRETSAALQCLHLLSVREPIQIANATDVLHALDKERAEAECDACRLGSVAMLHSGMDAWGNPLLVEEVRVLEDGTLIVRVTSMGANGRHDDGENDDVEKEVYCIRTEEVQGGRIDGM